MPQSPGSSSSTGSPEVANDFGANEWLVEEMFDQFQKDPSSVDPAWAAFFKAQDGGRGASNGTGSNGSATKPEAGKAKAEPAKADNANATALADIPTAER